MGEPATVLEPIEISSVPRERVKDIWGSVAEMIEMALSYGQGDSATAEDVGKDLIVGKSILWVMHRGDGDIIAVVVLSKNVSTKTTKLYVQLVSGEEMSLWLDQLIELLVDLKDIIGADCIEASCRPGLAKILSEAGWSKKAIIMELK